ncbi:F-box protein GID2-like [Silene latifolia]|uniref:F-box protein GID2-like n=1 Tax=Silene latifolia TaxID=37657 RepID=UPI003D78054C
MSNKRSLNHQDHHNFQISINQQIDTKKLKFDLGDKSEKRESHGDGGSRIGRPEREDHSADGEEKFQMFMKKLKFDLGGKSKERENNGNDDDSGESLFARLDENLLYEIFKHADARTLAVFSCVSKIWNRTAQDERLWELICTRRWIDVNHGGGEKQLRSVVLALGGFRRLYSLYLSKTAGSASVAASAPLAAGGRRGSKRWGKDEVNLSLSLLSIQFYEKMNNNNKGK